MPTTERSRDNVAAAGQHPRGRRLPIGAEPLADGGVNFRVWAPRRKTVEVVLEGTRSSKPIALAPEGNGYFSGTAPDVAAGALYRFRLDGGERLYPDPVSRFQPDGPHGPSQVVDPGSFRWTDDDWPGVAAEGQVLYEMHLGTFTPEGTYAAAAARLRALADVGVTCIELMPVAEFAGRFGWGYDGVDLFAPTHLYGTPDDLRRFVDAAHAAGVGVILDVVYNHFGPDGNYLDEFSEDYCTDKHRNDWGKGINFDGDNSAPVREFFLTNARYWVDEFHFDGFRFDATQALLDTSPEHILLAIVRAARAAAPRRSLYFVGENEPQHTRIVRPPEQGGLGLTSLWNDDFHHSAMVVLSGHNEAYYTDHRGRPQEFVSAAKYGYLFQGQRYRWQQARRGTPGLDLPPTAFVHFIQNHDQIANSGSCMRAHRVASPAQFRAMTALLLLMPQTPMLFQGQEFGSSSPFRFFADHDEKLAQLVREGRRREVSQFPSAATPEVQRAIPDPDDPRTFEACKLDWDEATRPGHAHVLRLHRDLLRLRREQPVFRRPHRRGDIDGAVLARDAFCLRFFGENTDDRLLLVNFGPDLPLVPAPEPLLAPPAGMRWTVLLSTEDPVYDGGGSPHPETEQEGWALPGRCTMFLAPAPAEKAAVDTRAKKAGSASGPRPEGEP